MEELCSRSSDWTYYPEDYGPRWPRWRERPYGWVPRPPETPEDAAKKLAEFEEFLRRMRDRQKEKMRDALIDIAYDTPDIQKAQERARDALR